MVRRKIPPGTTGQSLWSSLCVRGYLLPGTNPASNVPRRKRVATNDE